MYIVACMEKNKFMRRLYKIQYEKLTFVVIVLFSYPTNHILFSIYISGPDMPLWITKVRANYYI